jgi:hypothetical protein
VPFIITLKESALRFAFVGVVLMRFFVRTVATCISPEQDASQVTQIYKKDARKKEQIERVWEDVSRCSDKWSDIINFVCANPTYAGGCETKRGK